MKLLRILLLLAALAAIPFVVKEFSAKKAVAANDAATTSTPTANITSRTVTMNGQQVGEVLVGDNVVFRIRQAAGGYTAGQRAEVVASRLSTSISSGSTWQDLHVGTVNRETALLMGDQLIITADKGHANLNGVTPLQLASTWQTNSQHALRGAAVTTVAGSTEQWPAWTKTATKIVPIFSVGTPGVQLGAAQVTGPEERVKDVKAVLQLDLTFEKAARIKAFVPSSEIAGLKRVQGVAVSALLQYKLFKF